MPAHILQLLQLADSGFPSGSFAFSNGLESLAKLGHVKSLEDFRAYLAAHLDQVTAGDVPFLNSAFAAWEAPPGPAFAALALEWDAWLVQPSQRKASVAQARAWLRVLAAAYPLAAVEAVESFHVTQALPTHFLLVFAATLKATGKPLEDAQTLYLHMAIRDQLSAAVRLGLLGSLQAQKLHARFIGVAEDLLARRRDWDHTRSERSAPMIDLGQAGHPHLYSRLFQS